MFLLSEHLFRIGYMYNQNSGELVFHLWGQPSSKLVTTKEEGVERIFRIHNMYYPVGISVEQTSPLRGFPWVKPSDMIASMARTRDLHHLLAGHDLQNAESKLVSFWTKYRALHPQHELWAEIDNGRKSYARCLHCCYMVMKGYPSNAMESLW